MNSILFLALSCLLHVTLSQDPCDEQTPFSNGGVCLPVGDLCCECINDGCEGCETVDCPTTTSTLAETTTTEAPVTTTSAPETTVTTTSAPETTTVIGTTLTGKPCICTTESTPECPPSSDSDDSDGDECDCKGGMVELRFNYTGTDSNVEISLYDEKDQNQPICTFTNVNPKDEIVCNVNDDSPALIQTGLSKFPTNTRFSVQRNDGSTCAATYHTSCSKNIVGVVMDECDEVVASGWRDGDGGNCERDYVDTGGSKSKSRSGSRDGSDDECDCNGGIVELRFNYSGTATDVAVNLFSTKSKDDYGPICAFVGVKPKDEIICNVNEDSRVLIKSGLTKFPTNTGFTIQRKDGSTCEAVYHTSCSQNIVGVVMAECDELVVSGWRDGDGGNCDRDYLDTDGSASREDDPCKSKSRSGSKSSGSRHRMVRRLKGSKSASGSGSKKGSKSASKGSKGSKGSGSTSPDSADDTDAPTTTTGGGNDDEECICPSWDSDESSSESRVSKASSRGGSKKKRSRSDSTGSVSHGKKKKSKSSSSSSDDLGRVVQSNSGGSAAAYSSGMNANDDDNSNSAKMAANGGESMNGGDMLTDGGMRYEVMSSWIIAVSFGAYLFI